MIKGTAVGINEADGSVTVTYDPPDAEWIEVSRQLFDKMVKDLNECFTEHGWGL